MFPKVIISLLLACMAGTGVRAEVFSLRAPVALPHEATVTLVSDHYRPRVRRRGGFSIELRSGTHPHLQRRGWGRYRPYWDTPYYRNYEAYRFDRPRYRGRLRNSPFYRGDRFLFETVPVRPAIRPGHGQRAAHLAWCRDRYRSYRASDNTFQPTKGPRRICRSPYGR